MPHGHEDFFRLVLDVISWGIASLRGSYDFQACHVLSYDYATSDGIISVAALFLVHDFRGINVWDFEDFAPTGAHEDVERNHEPGILHFFFELRPQDQDGKRVSVTERREATEAKSSITRYYGLAFLLGRG